MDAETGVHSVELTVLTYNIAGLPFPRRSNTRGAMKRIEQAWSNEFRDGQPDVLLLQEAFVPSATRLAGQLGYTNVVRGPKRLDKPDPAPERATREFRQKRRLTKGERLFVLMGSGLVTATDLAVTRKVNQAFGRHSCAGYDCLANKGAMLIEIPIPGMPEPLFVLNTHLNSRKASGVADERSLYAYRRQVTEIRELLDREWAGRGPLIWAGDLNARGNLDRFTFQEERLPGELAHRYCADNPRHCDVRMSWDNDEPWLDTQDLQGFLDGEWVWIKPVAIAARFDEPVQGRMLSDHDALEVRWRLSWRPRTVEGAAGGAGTVLSGDR
ncbi:MAG TPA: endonuclease/exonuclease/phosphatase family protein [Croceibacterium sp.]|nr:endonuclease/exonuclease/phosphatase family protein [Croceibacterium sp.]